MGDRIDLNLLHWRGRVPLAETVEAMQRLQADGKIRHWGVSNLDTDDMEELLEASGAACVTDQLLYNLTRRGPEHALLPWLAGKSMSAMAYSPVEQGRLVGERDSRRSPVKQGSWQRSWRWPGCSGNRARSPYQRRPVSGACRRSCLACSAASRATLYPHEPQSCRARWRDGQGGVKLFLLFHQPRIDPGIELLVSAAARVRTATIEHVGNAPNVRLNVHVGAGNAPPELPDRPALDELDPETRG
uniref:aldo/keto reductase n=1 Tax=uncultured Sphingomonas sp. TaxID=158754 RepID=UPI0035CB5AD4